MTYRDPAPRQLRLWHVTIAYRDGFGHAGVTNVWTWAIESHDAINDIIQAEIGRKEIPTIGHVWFSNAVCGEDFADREALGPTKSKT